MSLLLKPNVLITGGTGYIGSHACLSFLNSGYGVVCLDNFSNSCRSTFETMKSLSASDSLFLVEGDVLNPTLLREIFIEFKVSSVIHFAALKSVTESFIKPLDYYRNNVVGLITLVEAMHAASVSELIYSSSATVYGNGNGALLSENRDLKATNPYGQTKIDGENFLKNVSEAYDLKILALRYFNPVGAHESGLLGEFPNEKSTNLMPILGKTLLNLGDKFVINGVDYDTPDGSCVRDYLHVLDVAEGHLAALEFLHTLSTSHFDQFNLGRGCGVSVLDMLREFELQAGRSIPHEFGPRRIGDVSTVVADVSKIEQKIGWRAIRDLSEMCGSSVSFYQNLRALI